MRPGILFASLALLACGGIDPASLEYVGTDPAEPRIGEITTVQFRATDERGEPMAGVEIEFSLEGTSPGVELLKLTALTNRGTGIAETQLRATSVASAVVIAEAGTKRIVSPPINFAGTATPNGKQLTFQCGSLAGTASGGVHAIGAFDSTRYLIAGVKLDCFAHVGDRNGDGIPGVQVSFLTEAGTIGPSATSVTDVVGNAGVLYKTSYPLPVDTDPENFTWNVNTDSSHTGITVAPLWMHPWDWKANPVLDYRNATAPRGVEPRRLDPLRGTSFCAPTAPSCVLNPRDNLVTMIAITRGEEGYWDQNSNGRYDDGEPFDDLTEPFVDSNDNGTRDPSERWVDTDGDGSWSPKNGQHDASTLIWVQERILWTGIPDALDYADAATPVSIVRYEDVNGVSYSQNIPHYGSIPVLAIITDPWFNRMAANGDGDGCALAGADKPVVNTVPSRVGAGTPAAGPNLTYPALHPLRFEVEDDHDESADPPDPPFASPRRFRIPLWCQTTGSRIEGMVVTTSVYIEGTVL